MVAIAGPGWRLSPSLVAMFVEADRIAPNRSHASDGTIGDASHAARTSQHNPADDPADRDRTRWGCAGDLTHDPRNGFDAHAHARRIAARKDFRIRYLISNGQWWENDGRGWKTYSGSNPHTGHMHASIWNPATARNLTDPWWPGAPGTATPPPYNPSRDEDEDAVELIRNDIQGHPAFGQIWLLRDRDREHIPDGQRAIRLRFYAGLTGGSYTEVTSAELWADLMDLYASPEESLVALSGLADVYATRTVEALRKAGVIA